MPNRNRTKNANSQLSQAFAATPRLPRASLRTAAACGLLILAIGAAYVPILKKEELPSPKAGFLMDDDALVIECPPIVQSGTQGLYDIWLTTKAADYWPVTNTAFWIEWRAFGMNPIGYHAVSLFLHCVEASLLWLILKRLTIPGAYWIALLFAVHPVNVESVAWIASQKNLWAMLFMQLAVLCYLKIELVDGSEVSAKRFALCYGLTSVFFIASLLGKGSAAVLPGVLALVSYWIRPLRQSDLYRFAPFIAIAVAFSCINVWFQTHGLDIVIRSGVTWGDRMILAGRAIWFYLYKALVPVGLTPFYPMWKTSEGGALRYAPIAAVLVVSGVLVFFQRKKISWARPIFVGWFFFLTSLFPVLGLADVGFFRFSLVADRYQHLAIIGILALVVGGLVGGAKAATVAWRRFRHGFLGVCVAICIIVAHAQANLYANAVRWYTAAIEANPLSGQAHNNLANEYYRTPGMRDAAEKEYLIAVELNPDLPEAQSNLGAIAFEHGRFEEAIERYKTALRLKPDHSQSHNNWGNALMRLNREDEAISHYQKALQLNEGYAEAHNNLAVALHNRAKLNEAISHYRRALEANPDYYDASYNLTQAYVAARRISEAKQEALRGLAISRKLGLQDEEKNSMDWIAKLDATQEASPGDQKENIGSGTGSR